MDSKQNPRAVLFLVEKTSKDIEAPFRLEIFENDIQINITVEGRFGIKERRELGTISWDTTLKMWIFSASHKLSEKLFLNERKMVPGSWNRLIDGASIVVGGCIKYFFLQYDMNGVADTDGIMPVGKSSLLQNRKLAGRKDKYEVTGVDVLSGKEMETPINTFCSVKCTICSSTMRNDDLVITNFCQPCLATHGEKLDLDAGKEKRKNIRSIATVVDEIAAQEFKRRRNVTGN